MLRLASRLLAPALLVACMMHVTDTAAAPPEPAPAPVPRTPPLRIDPCAPAAMSAALRIASAAPAADAAARAQAVSDAFKNTATSCITASLSWTQTARNDATTWARARTEIDSYLYSLYTAGILLGSKPAEAYLARCDQTTMSQADIDAGHLICVFGGAVIRPAELVIGRVTVSTVKPAP